MISTVGIFSGKKNTHNEDILTTLFNNGPLTTSQINNLLAVTKKQNLQSTIKNRLTTLERKDYIYHKNRQWLLRCKGIVAILIVEPDLDAWSLKWNEIFHKSIVIRNDSTTLLGIKNEDTEKTIHNVGLCLNDLNTWKGFAKITNSLIDKGIVNFEEITDSTLLSLLLIEALSLDDVAGLFPSRSVK